MGYWDCKVGSELSPNAPAWPGGGGSFRSAGPKGAHPRLDKWSRPGSLGAYPVLASSNASQALGHIPGGPAGIGSVVTLDKKKTARYMDGNAHGTQQFTGRCARACRLGLEAGGLNTTGHPGLAKEWAAFLENLKVPIVAKDSLDDYTPQQGDVAVFEGGGRDRSGHMEIYDGLQWVSDTRQQRFMPRRDYPGGFTIFRFADK